MVSMAQIKYWQTPKFKRLAEAWENILREIGFVDAEETVNGKRQLKQTAGAVYRHAKEPVQREQKQRYYELLGIYFWAQTFLDPVEQLIMERRFNGVMIKAISAELKAKGERCHRETVRHIIQKYERKWGMRK